MKCDCVKAVRETCFEMCSNVCDFDGICRQTGENLDSEIDHCESNIRSAKEARYLRNSSPYLYNITKYNILRSRDDKHLGTLYIGTP